MSARSLGNLPSIDSATLIGTNDTGRELEIYPYRTRLESSLRCTKPVLLFVQQTSPWATAKQRRYFDCAFAMVALFLCLPVFAIVSLMVFLDSPGPILFRQRRMGRNGMEFTLYKFRSMRTGETSGARITVSGDGRITRVGAFLRHHKLDELPQFWNVLKGDMSLVGPRPKLPDHEALRMTARPGITGAATLAFRHEEELLCGIPEQQLEGFYKAFIKPTKARMDLEYMRNATCRSDISLLWNTFACCLWRSRESLETRAEYLVAFFRSDHRHNNEVISTAN
jgi:lipopolysaccharide/colanic/teichoic acid biosynthesis glycosyltransferase